MKQALRVVRQTHQLSIAQVAKKAGISPGVHYQAEVGIAVNQEIAESILRALSLLSGQMYTQKNVTIAIRECEEQRPPLRPLTLVRPESLNGGQ